jgi:hypothetical protein
MTRSSILAIGALVVSVMAHVAPASAQTVSGNVWDLSVRLVTRASDTYAVAMATVYVTYHFEVHDVTW